MHAEILDVEAEIVRAEERLRRSAWAEENDEDDYGSGGGGTLYYGEGSAPGLEFYDADEDLFRNDDVFYASDLLQGGYQLSVEDGGDFEKDEPGRFSSFSVPEQETGNDNDDDDHDARPLYGTHTRINGFDSSTDSAELHSASKASRLSRSQPNDPSQGAAPHGFGVPAKTKSREPRTDSRGDLHRSSALKRNEREKLGSKTHHERGKKISARVSALAQDRRDAFRKREEEKAKREGEAAMRCTFVPQLLSSNGSVKKTKSSEPVHERLMGYRKAQESKLEELKLKLENEMAKECTFQPRLVTANNKKSNPSIAPIHERIWEIQREKEARARERQIQAEKLSEMPFRPTISAASEIMVQSSLSMAPQVGERLAKEAEQRALRHRDRIVTAEAHEAKQNTFTPQLSRGTRQLILSRPGLAAPFAERQVILEAKSRCKQLERRREVEKSQADWFTPQTTLKHKERTEDEGALRCPGQRWTEMSTGEARARAARQAHAEEEARSAFTYKPKITRKSASLARCADRTPHAKQRALAKAQEKLKEECPFKPHLVAETKSVWRESFPGADPYGVSNRYRMPINQPRRLLAEEKARAEQRWKKSMEVQAVREVEEMQACTFEPQIPKRSRARKGKNQQCVVIRGLGHYLEVQNAARRKIEEKKAREDAAFGGGLYVNKRLENLRDASGLTKVRPFRLSEGPTLKWCITRDRIIAERDRECQFNPRTLEHERKLLLDDILLEEEGEEDPEVHSEY